MNPITKWYKISKNPQGETTSISFNHYEDGWNQDSEFPPPFSPKFINQVAWSKDEWTKQYAYMNENNQIIKIDEVLINNGIKIIEREDEVDEIRLMDIEELEKHCKQVNGKFFKNSKTQ